MKRFTILPLLGISVLLINSCKKEAVADQRSDQLQLNKKPSELSTSVEYTSYGGGGGGGDVCGEATIATLFAGQHIDVGCVKVWNDEDNLYVKYETKDCWKIDEIHLYVGDCDNIPQHNGNPTPGQFPIKDSYRDGTNCATFSIPLSSLCECVCIAAHAVVRDCCTGQEETAWGDGCDFSGANWATYFKYCVQECDRCDKDY